MMDATLLRRVDQALRKCKKLTTGPTISFVHHTPPERCEGDVDQHSISKTLENRSRNELGRLANAIRPMFHLRHKFNDMIIYIERMLEGQVRLVKAG